MILTALEARHAAALSAFLAEFEAAGEVIHGWFLPASVPFADALDQVTAWSKGEQLRPGWVPCTTWFAEAAGELLGVLNFRHVLNAGLRERGGHIGYSVRPSARGRGIATWMLAQAIERARAQGVERLLLSCDPQNIASARTIERNGGVMEREVTLADGVSRLYWIG